MNESEDHHGLLYRKKAVSLELARALWKRPVKRIYGQFEKCFPPKPKQRILDLGVDSSSETADLHFFEYFYPYREKVVAAGLETGELFNSLYPQIHYVQVKRNTPLPFEDKSFDIVFCNAVIEHVGGKEQQARFLSDIIRVGKSAFVTTPNRWYPIELHTVMPLIHYLPKNIHRKILAKVGFDFYSKEDNLNLLDRKSLLEMIEPAHAADCNIIGFRYLGLVTNWLLIYQPTS